MTTPHVTEITSARRALYSPAYQTSGIPALDAYRARCAELRELDRLDHDSFTIQTCATDQRS